LTHLPNRNLFYERLEQVIISANQSRPVALLLLDLDRFTEIDDRIEHQVDDLLLQQFESRLESELRGRDIVARLRGDEFGILLPGAADDGATLVADRILKALKQPFTVGDLAFYARASVGIAVYPKHGQDKNTLMRRAGTAMCLAKESASGYAIYYSQDHDR
jgi:diguanylate cyclase (GGDEF)-like protein